MQLTIKRCYEIRDGLIALESGNRVEHGASGLRLMQEPFKLGALRFDIAVNLNRVKAKIDEFETGKNALIKELTKGGNFIDEKEQPELWKQFQEEISERLKEQVDVDLKLLPKDRLNLEENPIPIVALAALEELVQ